MKILNSLSSSIFSETDLNLRIQVAQQKFKELWDRFPYLKSALQNPSLNEIIRAGEMKILSTCQELVGYLLGLNDSSKFRHIVPGSPDERLKNLLTDQNILGFSKWLSLVAHDWIVENTYLLLLLTTKIPRLMEDYRSMVMAGTVLDILTREKLDKLLVIVGRAHIPLMYHLLESYAQDEIEIKNVAIHHTANHIRSIYSNLGGKPLALSHDPSP